MFEELLQEKVVLVTGASRGLGSTIARTFATAGATVAIHYNHSEREAKLLVDDLQIAGAEASAYAAEMTDAFEVDALVKRVLADHDKIDVLVNNVGPFADIPMLDLPEGDWQWILDTNLKSAYLASRRIGRAMVEADGGCIINIAAAAAFNPAFSVYALAKRGLIFLTEILALELAPKVRVNALAPGILGGPSLSEEQARKVLAVTPLERLVMPEEVARMVLLLSTDLFGTVTGQTLIMDGGRSLLRS